MAKQKFDAGLAEAYTVRNGSRFRLAKFACDDAGPFGAKGKQHADELLALAGARLAQLQEELAAQDRWSVLLVFQGMDASGKDSLMSRVFAGLNPAGFQVTSFKAPTAPELDHDFLWRHQLALPQRGRIGVFNRSHYEETLVVRVHPEYLKGARLPPALLGANVWKERFEDINAWERHLARNGTAIRKFYLHLSREEQARQFLERIDDPSKHWKYNAADVAERKHWDAYMEAYEQTIRATATAHAPWVVVPSDRRWFARLVVAAALIEALESLDLAYPVPDEKTRLAMTTQRVELTAELAPTKPGTT
ncbi:MAG: PPK2 family polyphosphate kinase [Lysobacterales bacterium]